MSKFDIFLSYQWAIQEKVKELHHQLTKLGFRVWMDVYQMAGGNLHSEIVNGIKNSEIFVCCVTTKYSESKNCENELCFAYDSNKKIIAIMFEKVTLGDLMGVGLILARLLRINAFDDENFPLNNQSERFLELITALNPDELTSANTSSKILKNNILSRQNFEQKNDDVRKNKIVETEEKQNTSNSLDQISLHYNNALNFQNPALYQVYQQAGNLYTNYGVNYNPSIQSNQNNSGQSDIFSSIKGKFKSLTGKNNTEQAINSTNSYNNLSFYHPFQYH